MSGRSKAEVTWGEAERLRLRAARSHAGHDMAACAQILRVGFGVATASQPNISRWETGATHRPQCVNELLAYCDAYGPSARTTVSVRRGPRTGPAGDAITSAPAADSIAGEVDEFDQLAGQVVGEPLLGPAQLELVRGMSRRLTYGPRLSPQDRATYLDQLRILRVPDGVGDW
jgi:hypothetical protein